MHARIMHARYNARTVYNARTLIIMHARRHAGWSRGQLKMGRLTIDDRLRVITLLSRGYSVSYNRKRLLEESVYHV